MGTSTYFPLRQDKDDRDEIDEGQVQSRAHTTLRLTGFIALFGVVIASSFCINAWLIYERIFRMDQVCNNVATKFAHLRRDTDMLFDPDPVFSSTNRTIQDAAWDDPRLNSWALFVALEEDYAISQGLLHSMRWPWDSDKGVYILGAAHEMHCVHIVRTYVNQVTDGVSESDLEWTYEHTIHCLNVLRGSVMCNANDQPLYTGRLHANVHADETIPGRGVTRKCHNWDHLVNWAHERSACYLAANRKDPTLTEVERYKHCPDGSRPWESQS